MSARCFDSAISDTLSKQRAEMHYFDNTSKKREKKNLTAIVHYMCSQHWVKFIQIYLDIELASDVIEQQNDNSEVGATVSFLYKTVATIQTKGLSSS